MKPILGFIACSLLLLAQPVFSDDYYEDIDDPSVAFIGDDNYDPFDYGEATPRESRMVYAESTRYSKRSYRKSYSEPRSSRIPQKISTSEKVIIVDPVAHMWGAYSAQGNLLRSGIATAGSNWCRDLGRPCRTRSGVFRIYSLGDASCISSKYPLGEGGAPMPYCMYFNGHQGIHGSYEVARANLSHGCVRVRVGDAEWIRYNFATRGTKVIVRSY